MGVRINLYRKITDILIGPILGFVFKVEIIFRTSSSVWAREFIPSIKFKFLLSILGENFGGCCVLLKTSNKYILQKD